MRCALIGEKLGHSFSKEIHLSFGEYSYELVEVESEGLTKEFLMQFSGVNVTIPYKKMVLELVDEVDEKAKMIGAVNTIVNVNGRLIAYNTDVLGMKYLADKCGLSLSGKKIVILGSGGTSATAVALSRMEGAREIVTISRNGENNYSNISRHSNADLLINTTPVGMYPNEMECPIDLDVFKNLEGVLDAIYNPLRTMLVQRAMKRGIISSGGLSMLTAQAKFARDLFLGNIGEDSLIENAEKLLLKKRKNIVLIGMAGSGKSEIGRELSTRLNMDFVDLDDEIEKKEGMTIPKVFEEFGEEYFRERESEVVRENSKGEGKVIATGGGVVTRSENDFHLKKNSEVFLIERDVEKLATKGRPLSKNLEAVRALYEKRRDRYHALADYAIDNNGDINNAIEQILRIEK